MLVENARRARSAAREMLALVDDGSASCDELREALAISKDFMAAGAAFQVNAAAAIAARERHGDGGAQVLADGAGLSQREARSHVKTGQAIAAAPALRDAVESGRVPAANARRLADAVSKTSAEAVDSDAELLAKAESMRPEHFAKEARRWTADHQHDGGAGDYQRLRAKRYLRIFDDEEGMVRLDGRFDPVSGRRIANRLDADARRLLGADKTNPGGGERRSFEQCRADALDDLTNRTAGGGGGKAFADICVIATVDDATGKLIAELPNGVRLPKPVLEELACNAELTGVVYDRGGKPIWRTEPTRRATKAQRQILFNRWGGCFHCGANPAMCQIHHIKPVSEGGLTRIDNLVPVCWECHQRIHHRGWVIHKRPDGRHTMHPPQHIHYGPAHMPERPSHLFEPEHQPQPGLPAQASPITVGSTVGTRPSARQQGLPMSAGPAAAESTAGPRPSAPQQSLPARAAAGPDACMPGPQTARAALRKARAARSGPGRAGSAERAPP